ncbi:hypothetical protein M0R45_018172 [Rubus argutus]|uniref:Uncharacterized protein n=1 Tax=Rubus argutus TaxID=59490 RepID=A0AAW1X4B7_RUBAR
MKSGSDDIVIDIVNDKKCIFRVPEVLRRKKKEAYTPDVVSIGPFHYRAPGKRAKRNDEGKEDDFQLMERVKQSYLNEILSLMGNISLKELTAKVTDELSDEGGVFEERARGFYAEPLDHISSQDFKEMMVVDGCFLIQLFRKCKYVDLRKADDPVFNMDCMFHFLCHDLLLLENQLPWSVLTTLYRLALDPDSHPHEPSLSVLILTAFTRLPSLKQSCSSYNRHLNKHKFHCDCDADVLHILDLIRASIVVPLTTKDKRANSKHVQQMNTSSPVPSLPGGLFSIVKIIRSKVRLASRTKQMHTTSRKDSRNYKDAIFDSDQHQMHTATALSKADIKFKNVIKESIMDIRFEVGGFCRNGILMIPQLNVGMSSETLFRNLIAFEQCYHGYSNEITSYAILMDNLISSQEDMELLCKEKVIGNWLSDEDGCNFFNNLHKDIPHNKFYYVDLCKQVNERYKMRRYTWLALLKSEKFSNPWRILAFGIAIIVLLLNTWASTNNIRIHM